MRGIAAAFKIVWIEAQEVADITERKWVEAQVEVGKVWLASWPEEKKPMRSRMYGSTYTLQQLKAIIKHMR